MELALEHAVLPSPDGTASVMDGVVRFLVEPDRGVCDCDWPGHGQSLCSHLAAVAITAYAQRHLALKLQPPDQHAPFGWPESSIAARRWRRVWLTTSGRFGSGS